MGETPGGAPYGLSVAEFRTMNAMYDHAQPWAAARRAFLTALDRVAAPDAATSVDFVESIGRGRSRRGYTTRLEIDPDPDGLSGQYVALINCDPEPDYPQCLYQEMRVLEWLFPRLRRIRVPMVLALVEEEPAPILVVSHVPGIEVDLRHGRMPVKPWDFVAEIAAAIHTAPLPPADILAPRDRRQHRADEFHDLFDDLEAPPAVIADAAAWMREHIDRPGPGALLHGDLLAHNLRFYPNRPPGVLDWQNTELGDPAHDLALITRGIRRPFRVPEGATRLLAAYEARGGAEVELDDLRFFELALHVRLWRQTPSLASDSHSIIARLLREA